MALSPKQRKLLDHLRRLEEQEARLPRTELLARLERETGYKELATYLSKYLGPVVRRGADDLLEVHGVLAMSEDDFAALLTQKRLSGEARVLQYEDRDEWAEALRALVRHGIGRGYILDFEDVSLIAELMPALAKRDDV